MNGALRMQRVSHLSVWPKALWQPQTRTQPQPVLQGSLEGSRIPPGWVLRGRAPSPQDFSYDESKVEFDVDAPSGVVMEGYLFKRASNAFKTWNRRWFSIQNSQLVYQKKLKDALTVVVDDLRLCSVKPCEDIERRFCFEVVSPTKSCMLQADSEKLRQAWVQAVQASIASAYRESPDSCYSEVWSSAPRLMPIHLHATTDGPAPCPCTRLPLQMPPAPTPARAHACVPLRMASAPANPDACHHGWLLQAVCCLCSVGVHVCMRSVCPREGVHVLVEMCAGGALACAGTSSWGGGELLGETTMAPCGTEQPHPIPQRLDRTASPSTSSIDSATDPRERSMKGESVLQRVQSVAGNSQCGDCGQPDPRWASINLGVLLCIECSGIHRSLGVHCSKVRSLTLDSWEPELLKLMCELGNSTVNQIYEAQFEGTGSRKPSASSPRQDKEAWIKDKYVEKKFLRKAPVAPAREAPRRWRAQKCLRPHSSPRAPAARRKVRPEPALPCVAALSSVGTLEHRFRRDSLFCPDELDSLFSYFDAGAAGAGPRSLSSDSGLGGSSDGSSDVLAFGTGSVVDSVTEEEGVESEESSGEADGDAEAEAWGLADVRELHPGLLAHRAARARDLPALAAALAHGAEVNWADAEDEGKTPLVQAVLGVHTRVCIFCGSHTRAACPPWGPGRGAGITAPSERAAPPRPARTRPPRWRTPRPARARPPRAGARPALRARTPRPRARPSAAHASPSPRKPRRAPLPSPFSQVCLFLKRGADQHALDQEQRGQCRHRDAVSADGPSGRALRGWGGASGSWACGAGFRCGAFRAGWASGAGPSGRGGLPGAGPLHLAPPRRLRLARMAEEMREAEAVPGPPGALAGSSPTELQFRRCIQEFISLHLEE
ncbi:ArfGAP with coiled-coil, ankyrin repeat and PH domains 3, partial [Saguinus oedipus]